MELSATRAQPGRTWQEAHVIPETRRVTPPHFQHAVVSAITPNGAARPKTGMKRGRPVSTPSMHLGGLVGEWNEGRGRGRRDFLWIRLPMAIADVKAAEYLFEASRVATERYGPAALPRRRGPPGTPQ
jgi:hypothetical protein